MKIPSTKDTIGCTTEIKQPEVPKIVRWGKSFEQRLKDGEFTITRHGR
jgi:hypothetical protein